ncbi:MAG: pyrimidine-nucleoside phosphorylase [Lachnospiraceae bacterium]|nr:pyrimidine-nucleoside phosphorylase [Lachnospiraceae bacterium]
MRMYDIIMKKRNGHELSEEEISFAVQGFTDGSIPDYQISALMMAVYFQGMNEKETIALTMAMAHSGDLLDLSAVEGIKVDKHSTGGVGDKTSLVVGPMVAALGVPVAKMSGRGLGHTGGTIDKLESISGFQTTLSTENFIENVNKIHMSIVGQTANLAPADKKLYALRDVTATVDNLSLIASSIMSKKIASGADAIVLDVKTGSGAFMKTEKDAIDLAREMVKIGTGAGKDTIAVVSNMDQPLGNMVGNALEVKEAVETLNGNGPEDLMELSYVLGAYMLIAAGKADSLEEGMEKLRETIENKSALNKFREFIEAQGGDGAVVENTDLLPKASIVMDIISEEAGFIKRIDTSEIGMVSLILGGGRETKDSEIDLSVGIELKKKIGDRIEKEEVIATIYANDLERLKAARERLDLAYEISVTPVNKQQLVKWVISKNGAKKY